MASGGKPAVLRSVDAVFRVGAAGGMSDGQLLERFVARRDDAAGAEVAFGALVERHGPMVLGVCRQWLRDEQDAEDAFQATFLVLVRSAGSIRRREALAGWLCGVARRVAGRAKAAGARRRLRERQGAEGVPETSTRAGPGDDDRAALLDEVARLPDTYREAVVLCYLEARTYDEAARQLGLTEAAVRGRLARARDLLRTRLTRRGLGPGCGALAMVRWPSPPAGLVEATARASGRFLAGDAAAAGAVSASAAALAKGVVRTMFWNKLKLAVVPGLALGAIVVGAGLHAQPGDLFGRSGARTPAAEAGRDGQAPGRDEAERDLARLVRGRIVRTRDVEKDCMVLSYLPDWAHGEVDNLAVANNDGGVRTLVSWPAIDPEVPDAPDVRFLLALYSRKTTSAGQAGSILAFPLLADWPERTSWTTLPEYAEEPAATYKFLPGDGWKLFDITPVVRARAGRSGQGVLLRFLREDRSEAKKDWSGYAFVSREGDGEWADRRPRLLVVGPGE